MERPCKSCGNVYPRTIEYWHIGGNTDGFSPVCKECARERTRKWKLANKVTYKPGFSSTTLSNRRLRFRVIQAYGGKCVCCGETHMEFLSLDHINGGGGRERKLRGSGHQVYREVEWAGYPPEFRVLCHNCNQSYGYNGYCPHRMSPDDYSKWSNIDYTKRSNRDRSRQSYKEFCKEILSDED